MQSLSQQREVLEIGLCAKGVGGGQRLEGRTGDDAVYRVAWEGGQQGERVGMVNADHVRCVNAAMTRSRHASQVAQNPSRLVGIASRWVQRVQVMSNSTPHRMNLYLAHQARRDQVDAP